MSTEPRIYLDYHATTPVDPRVVELVVQYMTERFGNASSVDHVYGDEAGAAVAAAKKDVALLVGAAPRSVVFTSGATESINLAIQGFVRARARHRPSSRPRIAVSPIEHRAVLDTCEALQAEGLASLTWLQVDRTGQLEIEHLEAVACRGVDLACVMAANNEIGTISPLKEISAICASSGVCLMTDATQAAGKVPLHFDDWSVGLMALTAHKMYGPKGIGALLVSPQVELAPLIHGGGHQRGIRSGTLNVPGVAGFGLACRLRHKEMATDEAEIALRRDSLESSLQQSIPDLVVNGDRSHRLAGNLHVSVPDVPNTAVVARLRHRLAISTGSACSSGTVAQSHVLRGIGLPEYLAEGSLRFGLGKFTTGEEVETAAKLVTNAVRAVRAALTG
jgi:cysteine desulfurase